jgi:2-oxoglutarate dehydrogenase E2 component (dihydrolipoamide succinyltransferase)
MVIIRLLIFCDISIAVWTKRINGSCVRNAENLTFRGVEADIKRLAIKARDGQITVDDMTGGTLHY